MHAVWVRACVHAQMQLIHHRAHNCNTAGRRGGLVPRGKCAMLREQHTYMRMACQSLAACVRAGGCSAPQHAQPCLPSLWWCICVRRRMSWTRLSCQALMPTCRHCGAPAWPTTSLCRCVDTAIDHLTQVCGGAVAGVLVQVGCQHGQQPACGVQARYLSRTLPLLCAWTLTWVLYVPAHMHGFVVHACTYARVLYVPEHAWVCVWGVTCSGVHVSSYLPHESWVMTPSFTSLVVPPIVSQWCQHPTPALAISKGGGVFLLAQSQARAYLQHLVGALPKATAPSTRLERLPLSSMACYMFKQTRTVWADAHTVWVQMQPLHFRYPHVSLRRSLCPSLGLGATPITHSFAPSCALCCLASDPAFVLTSRLDYFAAGPGPASASSPCNHLLP